MTTAVPAVRRHGREPRQWAQSARSFELSTNGALVETVPQTPSLYDANPSASVSIFGTPIPQLRPSSLQRALEAEGEALDRPVLPLVEIDASALAWIQVRDRDGQPVVSKMLQAGQSHTLFAESGLELSTGSIENLTIRIDGQKVRVPVRNPEMVVTTVPLDAQPFKALVSVRLNGRPAYRWIAAHSCVRLLALT